MRNNYDRPTPRAEDVEMKLYLFSDGDNGSGIGGSAEIIQMAAIYGASFALSRTHGIFPPLKTLNAFLQTGVDDLEEMPGVLSWVPFTLDEEAYQLCEQQLSRHLQIPCRVETFGLEQGAYGLWFVRAFEQFGL